MSSQADDGRHAGRSPSRSASARTSTARRCRCRTASRRRCRACREEVRDLGVTTLKSSPNLMMVVHLTSPDGRYDSLYLRNYATLNIRDALARLPGMGDVRVFGAGDYSMRVWLDPQKLAARNLTTGDVVDAIREQNVQVAAGQIGAPPAADRGIPGRAQRQWAACRTKSSSATSSSRPARPARSCASATSRASSSAPRTTRCAACSTTRTPSRSPSTRRPARTRSSCRPDVRDTMEELKKDLPGRRRLRHHLRHRREFVRQSIEAVLAHAARSHCARRARRHPVPADVARVDHPAGRGAGVDHRHVRGAARVRVLDQHAVAVRPGARDRHRGGRRHRRRRERRAAHRATGSRRSRPPRSR